MIDRKPIFDAVRAMLGRSFAPAEVAALDAAISTAEGLGPATAVKSTSPTPPTGKRQVGPRGKALIKKWEGCGRKRADGRFEAYPDPGSADGKPWTIGWGSTGADIGPGTIWTQQQCDERFNRDIQRYADEVSAAIGDAETSQGQFDALVSFHYNTGKIATATLTKRHRDERYAGAQAEFGKWVYNDGKVMKGLVSRRADEAALYGAA